MTQCFIRGLIGCIHIAHENGYRDSAENFRYILDELTKGFAAVVKVEPGYMQPEAPAELLRDEK
jgi:hypothetical protein